MHTYRKVYEKETRSYLYTVGFHSPSETTNDWTPMEDFASEAAARALVSYLNGGAFFGGRDA